ncbi:TetR/AcrR family transcriptional regulator [Mycobacterium sp. NPDC050853]|uniref:TetR/AcrR family transcriptional regulator n=1 Tax=Mycobacteriaceae TaxID=1762 RepID=UPI0015DDBE80|nr:TetR/AcrR family transcriptional regulator [Mycobacteroides sp. LB1]
MRTEELLDAAERAIRKSGGAVSIAEVAREAGFARSACYAIFPTKADLLRALSRRHADRVITRSWQEGMVGKTRNQLRAFANLVIDWITAEPELYIALDRDLTAKERLDHGIFDLIAEVTEEHLRAIFPAEQMTCIAPIWSRLATGGILMVINWWTSTRHMTRDELVGYIVETFATGVTNAPRLAAANG